MCGHYRKDFQGHGIEGEGHWCTNMRMLNAGGIHFDNMALRLICSHITWFTFSFFSGSCFSVPVLFFLLFCRVVFFWFEIHKSAIIDHQKIFLAACSLLTTSLHLPFILCYIIYKKKVVPYSIRK